MKMEQSSELLAKFVETRIHSHLQFIMREQFSK